MTSPSYTEDLLDRIRTLPDDKIAEVADFVEFLHARRQQQAAPALDELEARAVTAGLLRMPDSQARMRSTADAPPIQVGGRPASEIALEDRR
jgi:hypothetical protein